MVTKKHLDLDDLGLGDNFTDATMDFSAQTSRGSKRSAIFDLGKITAKGAASSIGEGAFIRQSVKKYLPQGYGSALDFTDEAATGFKSLYNTAATEIRPAVNDLKRTTQRLMPAIGNVVPGPIKRTLDRWSKDIDGQTRYNPEDAIRAQIEQSQQEIFKYQFDQQQKDRAEKIAKDEIKDQVDQKRFNLQSTLLNQISLSTQKLAAYQDQVTINYQRKMMELSYRQVYLLRDTHEEQKRINVVMTEGLKAIIHNTALPDYEKLTERNRVGGFMRNQFASMVGSGIGSARSNFMRNLSASANRIAREKLGQFVSGAQTGVMAVNAGLDMNEQMKQMAELSAQMGETDYGWKGSAASMLGGMVGQWGAGKLMSRYKDRVNNNSNVQRYGQNLQMWYQNLPQLAARFANSDIGEGKNPILDLLLQYGKGTINDALKDGPTNLHQLNYGNLQAAAVYTNQNAKSIDVVIPGLISRLIREVTVLRTGDESTPLIQYDFAKGRFDTKASTERNALRTAFSDYGVRDIKDRTAEITKLVDDPNAPFTNEEKRALADHLLRLNRRKTGIGDRDTLSNPNLYRGMAEPHAERLSGAFSRYFGDDESGIRSKNITMSALVNSISTGVEERKAVIQDLANAGYLEMLQRAGVVDEKGENINMDRFYALHLEDDPVLAAIGEDLERVAPNASRRIIPGFQEINRPRRGRRLPTRRARLSTSPITPTLVATEGPQPVVAPGPSLSAYEFQGPVRPNNAVPPQPTTQAQPARKFDWSGLKDPVMQATERLHDDLNRIEMLVEKGTQISITRYKIDGLPNIPGLDQLGERAQSRMRQTRGLLDRSLREHLSSARDFAQNKAQWSWNFLRTNAPKARDFAADQVENIKERGRRGWAKFEDTKNVYLKGEKMPRLMSAKLKAGEYIDDATGKVLESYKDIRGAVRDRITNEIVITTEEAKEAFIRYGPVQKLLTALGVVIDKGRDFADRALASAQSVQIAAVAFAKRQIDKLKDYLDGPQDIYIAGSSEPVILARIMRAGGYRLKMDPAKVVSKVTDINGPVLDAEGNEVLTMADLKSGIFDRFGRPIKTGWMRGIDIVSRFVGKGFATAKDKLTKGIKQVADAGRIVGTKAMDTAKTGWEAFSHWIGVDGVMISGGKKIVDRLTEIRDMLNDRLPGRKHAFGDRDGDGIRDGSVEDIQRKRKEAKEQAAKEKEAAAINDIDKELGKNGPLAQAIDKLSEKMKGGKEGLLGRLGGWRGLLDRVPGSRRLRNRLGKSSRIRKLGGYAEKLGGALSWLPGIGGIAGDVLGGLGGMVAGGDDDDDEDDLDANPGVRTKADRRKEALRRLKARRARQAGGFVSEAEAAAAKRGIEGAGKKGLLRRGLGLAGRGLRAGWNGAGWLLKARSMGGLTGFALGGAGDALGGLVLDGLVAGAGGLLSVLASPVVIGGAAAAAAAYGGYKLYKYIAGRQSLNPINGLRYAQYGFLPSDKDHVQAVFTLEDKLAPNLRFNKNGMADLDLKKIAVVELYDLFGIDRKNRNQLVAFATWFVKRFKPVYLTHMTILHKLTGATDMSGIKKLKDDQKQTYVDGAKFPEGPYSEMTSPFPDFPKLQAGAKDVEAAAEACLKELQGTGKKDEKPHPIDGKGIVGAKKVVSDTPQTRGDKGGGPAILNASAKISGKLPGKVAEVGAKTVVAAGAATGATVALMTGKTMDAMTVVRMKTYGLMEMDPSKVQALLNLEQMVEPSIKMTSTQTSVVMKNKSMQAVYNGNESMIIKMVGPQFGISPTDANAISNWHVWFNARFLPTYLAYRSALSTQTGQEKKETAEAQLSNRSQQAVTIAQAVVAAQASGKFWGGSVWSQGTSPWANYSLNMDSKSCDANILALNQVTGRTALPEAKARVVAKANTPQSKPADTKPKSFMDRVKDTVSNAWESVKQTGSNIYQGAKDAVKSAGAAVGDAAARAGNKVGSAFQSVGNAISNVGASIRNYVAPRLSANAAAVKASLLKAMAAAGIKDPTEQAMFLAQMDTESGGFKSLSENLNYKGSRLAQVFPKYFRSAADAEQVAQGGPEAIANRVYGNRMGNSEPGDGYKYRGRGVIQLTGKANYAKYGKAIGVDLVNNPDMAADPDIAAKVAIAYWKDRVSSRAAQSGDVKSVTYAINGGYNGLGDRQSKFQMYLQQAKSGQLAGAAEAAGGVAAAGAPGSDADTRNKAVAAAASGQASGGATTASGPSAPPSTSAAPAAAPVAASAAPAGGKTSDPIAQAKSVASAPQPKTTNSQSPMIPTAVAAGGGMPTVTSPTATTPSSQPVARDPLQNDNKIQADQLTVLKSIDTRLIDAVKYLEMMANAKSVADTGSGQPANNARRSSIPSPSEMRPGPVSMQKTSFGIT